MRETATRTKCLNFFFTELYTKMSASPVARIEQLKQIEKEVVGILQSAGQALQEISRDRPSQKHVDQLNTQVMANIKNVDSKLSEQIKYLTQVSTGHPHEGSSYPSQKVLQTAWHRLEHAKSRIGELEQKAPAPSQQQQQQQKQVQAKPPPPPSQSSKQ